MDNILPEASVFCDSLAALHQKSRSPTGQYGFHVVTYNGDLPQANQYTASWETCFTTAFEDMIQQNLDRGGHWEDMKLLRDDVVRIVIPRLIRPLESHGRSIKPSLVHGDLWCGNTGQKIEPSAPLVYDPASFYAHNECLACSLPVTVSVLMRVQMSWGIGDRRGMGSRKHTWTHTRRHFHRQSRQRILMIVMPCTQCRYSSFLRQ